MQFRQAKEFIRIKPSPLKYLYKKAPFQKGRTSGAFTRVHQYQWMCSQAHFKNPTDTEATWGFFHMSLSINELKTKII